MTHHATISGHRRRREIIDAMLAGADTNKAISAATGYRVKSVRNHMHILEYNGLAERAKDGLRGKVTWVLTIPDRETYRETVRQILAAARLKVRHNVDIDRMVGQKDNTFAGHLSGKYTPGSMTLGRYADAGIYELHPYVPIADTARKTTLGSGARYCAARLNRFISFEWQTPMLPARGW